VKTLKRKHFCCNNVLITPPSYLIRFHKQFQLDAGAMSDPSHSNKLQKTITYPDEIEIEDATGSNKQTIPKDNQSIQKKSKGAITMILLSDPMPTIMVWLSDYGNPSL